MSNEHPHHALPEGFVERLAAIVPAERLAACLASFAAEVPTALRTNTLVLEPQALARELAELGLTPEPLSFCPSAFVVPSTQRDALVRSDAALRGALYVQNASSLVPPLVLAPEPGERVLDLAAAPGGKALHLACLMQNRGHIGAVEAVRARFFRLERSVALHKASVVRTFLKDGAHVWKSCPEQFDRVLLDAPCSSEARFRSDEQKTSAYWSERKIGEMSRKQKRLLYSALQCLRPGGVLVYATCSFAPEENELVIARLLASFGDAVAVEPLELPFANTQPGLTSWRDRALPAALAGARRILPEGPMDGFFVCRLRKLASTLGERAARRAR